MDDLLARPVRELSDRELLTAMPARGMSGSAINGARRVIQREITRRGLDWAAIAIDTIRRDAAQS